MLRASRIAPLVGHSREQVVSLRRSLALRSRSRLYASPAAGSDHPRPITGPCIEYDLSENGRHYDDAYRILASLVVPRPIALVTTKGPDGSVNAAPYSFFNVLGTDPPYVAFAPGNRSDGSPKDTARNIMACHNFVVNLVDESIAEAMNKCAAVLPYGESELKFAGLTTVASSVVSSPRILEAPATLECTEYDVMKIGNNRLVVGVVQRVHIRADLVQDVMKGRIDRNQYHAVGRMQAPGMVLQNTGCILSRGAKGVRRGEMT